MNRRIRERRNERAAQRRYEKQMQTAHLAPAPSDDPYLPGSGPAPAAQLPSPQKEFLPKELRVPSREELTGLMMRHDAPLIIDGEIRACPQCGAYRMWVVLIMGENVWLRCPAAHETYESRLDAAWYNRNSGPMSGVHASLEDGLNALGL